MSYSHPDIHGTFCTNNGSESLFHRYIPGLAENIHVLEWLLERETISCCHGAKDESCFLLKEMQRNKYDSCFFIMRLSGFVLWSCELPAVEFLFDLSKKHLVIKHFKKHHWWLWSQASCVLLFCSGIYLILPQPTIPNQPQGVIRWVHLTALSRTLQVQYY